MRTTFGRYAISEVFTERTEMVTSNIWASAWFRAARTIPFLALVLALAATAVGCGYTKEGAGAGSSAGVASTDLPAGETSAATIITMDDPGRVVRPLGQVVLQASWGTAPGQFGIGEATPRSGPMLLAVSPDAGSLAILDWANARLQVFARDGKLLQVVPLDEGWDSLDMAWDGPESILLLDQGSESVVRRIVLDGGKATDVYPAAPEAFPDRLMVEGGEIWVHGESDLSYPVVLGGTPLDAEAQHKGARQGFFARSGFVSGSRQDELHAEVRIAEPTGLMREFALMAPATLPIQSWSPMGRDRQGNVYVAILNYSEHRDAPTSFTFLGISSSGQKLGQLVLPLDGTVGGGGFELGDDGRIYEMRCLDAGLEVREYSLGGVQ